MFKSDCSTSDGASLKNRESSSSLPKASPVILRSTQSHIDVLSQLPLSHVPRKPSSHTRTPGSQSPRTPGSQSPRTPSSHSPRTPGSHSPRIPGSQSPRAFGTHSSPTPAPSSHSPQVRSARPPRTPVSQAFSSDLRTSSQSETDRLTSLNAELLLNVQTARSAGFILFYVCSSKIYNIFVLSLFVVITSTFNIHLLSVNKPSCHQRTISSVTFYCKSNSVVCYYFLCLKQRQKKNK